MRKSLSNILALLLVAGCTTAKLPEPTAVYPTPPAALMEPTQNMETIPLVNSR